MGKVYCHHVVIAFLEGLELISPAWSYLFNI